MKVIHTAALAAGLLAALGSALAAPAPDRAAILAAHAEGAAKRMAGADAAFAQGTRPAPQGASQPASAPNPRGGPASPPLVINEGFEGMETFQQTGGALHGGIFANGWIRQNNSDAPYLLWFKGSPGAMPALDGAQNAFLAQNWFATRSNTGTASAWILTPPINFGSGGSFSFHTRTTQDSTQADRLQVRVCTGPCTDVGTLPEDVGSFGTLLLDINPSEAVGGYPESWTPYTLGAADGLPTSGTGRVAFRYYFHQNDGVVRGNYIGIDRVVANEGTHAAGPTDLDVTLAVADPAAPQACGTATTLDVAVGDQVNVCYRLTNRTADTLRYQALRDDVTGPLLINREQAIAPGATWQYNRVITVGESQSPSVTWEARRERPGYTPDDTQPAQYIDAGDGTEIDAGEVFFGARVTFPPDFDFRLFGERVSTLCVMDFGFITSLHYDSCPIGQLASGAPRLPDYELTAHGSGMALYTTTMQPGGRFFHKTLGAAPNRRYVVEYREKPVAFGSADPARGLAAEVVLHEGTHVIEFQYKNVVLGGHPAIAYGGSASIGLQTRQLGQQYSYLQQSLRTVNRIAWTPSDPTVHSVTKQVHLTARAPALRTSAASIDATVPAHGSANASVSIANDGDGRLDWTAGIDAAANSHFAATPRFVAQPAAATRAFDPIANAAPRGEGTSRGAPQAAATADVDLPLLMFDIGNGYLLRTNAQSPGYDAQNGAIKGFPRARLITGADFLDDDFGRLYAYDASSHELVRYDPVSTAPNVYANETLLGTLALPTGPFAHGFKQDPTSGTVYLVTTDGQGSRLWTVDPNTLAVRDAADIDGMPGVLAIAFDKDGRLYGVDGVFDALIAIDKTNGAAQVIGPLGIATEGNISSLAFDADDGALYFAGFAEQMGGFYRVDTVTGTATLLTNLYGPDDSLSQIGAMAFAHRASRCTRAADVPWLTVAPGSGSVAPGAAPGVLSLGFNAGALDDGVYRANLCVHSNDPLHRRRAVPVTLTVGRGDTLFADGFEGAQP